MRELAKRFFAHRLDKLKAPFFGRPIRAAIYVPVGGVFSAVHDIGA